jgi:hypothetical protein
MDTLDLWIEFVYSQEENFDTYLIDPKLDNRVGFVKVKYTVNTEAWSFQTYPRLDVFSYLSDIYNVMLF